MTTHPICAACQRPITGTHVLVAPSKASLIYGSGEFTHYHHSCVKTQRETAK